MLTRNRYSRLCVVVVHRVEEKHHEVGGENLDRSEVLKVDAASKE